MMRDDGVAVVEVDGSAYLVELEESDDLEGSSWFYRLERYIHDRYLLIGCIGMIIFVIIYVMLLII